MTKRICQAAGDNHSGDIIEVWYGSSEPLYLCGFHESLGCHFGIYNLKDN